MRKIQVHQITRSKHLHPMLHQLKAPQHQAGHFLFSYTPSKQRSTILARRKQTIKNLWIQCCRIAINIETKIRPIRTRKIRTTSTENSNKDKQKANPSEDNGKPLKYSPMKNHIKTTNNGNNEININNVNNTWGLMSHRSHLVDNQTQNWNYRNSNQRPNGEKKDNLEALRD